MTSPLPTAYARLGRITALPDYDVEAEDAAIQFGGEQQDKFTEGSSSRPVYVFSAHANDDLLHENDAYYRRRADATGDNNIIDDVEYDYDDDEYEDDDDDDDEEFEDDDEEGQESGRVKEPFHVRHAGTLCLSVFVVLLGAIIGSGAAFYSVRGSILPYNTTLILVSLDGFRPEYLERGITPNITAFGTTGVRAKFMRPSFPSKTFPNHYSIVTGLRPESHGIVSNCFFDPKYNETFLVTSSTTSQSKWWGGEPFWNTVEKAGHKSACYFWPGSDAPIQNMRPTYYIESYEHLVPNEARIDQVIEWLKLPYQQRPHFVSLYISIADDTGHQFGPDSPEMNDAIRSADQVFGYLLNELDLAGLLNKVNIMLVSDHGMTATTENRVVLIDSIIKLDTVRVIEMSPQSPIVSIIPETISEEALFLELKDSAADHHYQVYWKNSPNVSDHAPERYHYEDNDRITPIIVVMDLGWSMTDQTTYDLNPTLFNGGSHGYDNDLPDMLSIFLGSGPAFQINVTVDPFDNIELYNLMAKIMNIKAAPNQGTINSTILIDQSLLPLSNQE